MPNPSYFLGLNPENPPFFPAFLRNVGILFPDFTLMMMINILPAGKKTPPAGCGMLLPRVYWVLREKASVRKSDLCKMLEFGKLTSPSLKTSRESCCVKSWNCCSQFQFKDCENDPKLNRTATPEPLFLRNVVFLGRISFILPQTWLMGGKKGDFGTVWHNPSEVRQ